MSIQDEETWQDIVTQNMAYVRHKLDALDKKLDKHISDESHDLRSVKAHLHEAIHLMSDIIKDATLR